MCVCVLSMKDSLLTKVVLRFKVVKIYTKMHYNGQNFRGQMSGGGGQANQIFTNWDPQSLPQEKKTQQFFPKLNDPPLFFLA